MTRILPALALSLALVSPVLADEVFVLRSPDIAEGEPLDILFVLDGFGCRGGNTSPALAWRNAPDGTESFVITAYDPDAPTGSGWWHWVAFDIPADADRVDRGAGSEGGVMPAGTIQSRTDFGSTGFGGACPPPGAVHRYEFTIHALGVSRLGLDASASGALVGFMTGVNSLGSARITAVYTR